MNAPLSPSRASMWQTIVTLATVVGVAALPTSAHAAKVLLNPSNQMNNPVKGGGVEGQYALINANLAAAKIAKAGITVKVDQDFYNAPKNANSWGANLFLSVHSNAGGGHGTETLYKTAAGKALAAKVQAALLANLPFQSRGLKLRTNLYVLNVAKVPACLAEVVFHDCATSSGLKGHPPSESAYLRSTAGQASIATGIAAGACAYLGKKCGAGGSVTPPTKTGVLKGVVYKAPNPSDRIAGATVTLNSGQTTTSSATGFWQFTLKPGTYTATAKKSGFQTGSKTTVVLQDKTVWGSIGLTAATVPLDSDKDGVPDSKDNCPMKANPDQKDSDNDGKGDACDPPAPDQDSDGVPDSLDNCPSVANPDQKDSNKDGIGDVCQPSAPDQDQDGIADAQDNCPTVSNADQSDSDKDGVGDACQTVPVNDAGPTGSDAGGVDGVDGVDAGGLASDAPSSVDAGAASLDTGVQSDLFVAGVDTGETALFDTGHPDLAAGARSVASAESGCQSSRAGGAPWAMFLLLTAALALARRRRRGSPPGGHHAPRRSVKKTPRFQNTTATTPANETQPSAPRSCPASCGQYHRSPARTDDGRRRASNPREMRCGR